MLLPYITVAFTYVSVCWDLLIHLETGLNIQTVDITMLIIKPWVLEYCDEYISWSEWATTNSLVESFELWVTAEVQSQQTEELRESCPHLRKSSIFLWVVQSKTEHLCAGHLNCSRPATENCFWLPGMFTGRVSRASEVWMLCWTEVRLWATS